MFLIDRSHTHVGKALHSPYWSRSMSPKYIGNKGMNRNVNPDLHVCISKGENDIEMFDWRGWAHGDIGLETLAHGDLFVSASCDGILLQLQRSSAGSGRAILPVAPFLAIST
ncbi:hypothetical protein AVEN_9946-1 [Araneus ventricosus]|uniref:Uncharacterized protein n=1 Tax=Araneus ventricosus TaxID=182803 RepID=A0A4Y2QIR9_ARAVE|nr:hypothetical protein AVEN_9946-1 [Araneus ventricosus]